MGGSGGTSTRTGGGGGGGGGGGYYGGGGSTNYGGGGGGSSWVTPTGSSAPAFTAGANTGNGSLTLTPGGVYTAPTLDGSNFVNLPGDNLGNHTATKNLNLAANQLVGNGGSTGLAVSSTGSVGIGTSTAPAAKLEVVGDVRIPAANNYTYASARAKTVLLGAFDFRAENGTAGTVLDGRTDELYPTAAAGGVFRAPLHLPQGAIITGITLVAYDNNGAADITAGLISYRVTGGNRATLATARTTGSPAYIAVTSTTIATTVDNDNVAYSVRVTFGAGNTNLLTLLGVKVSYTIARVE
jgi:hypothetical protein